MAFRRGRKTTVTTSTRHAKTSKVHEVDGCRYKTKALENFNIMLKGDKFVKDFVLPTVQDEKENKNKKFGAKKCWINGFKFDSLMEARYYVYLLHEKAKKHIIDFSMQVPYELLPKYKNKFTGKTVLAVKYIADYVIKEKDGTETVIDVKGRETPEFKIKKKIFGLKYPDTKFLCLQWSEKDKTWYDLEELKRVKKPKKGKRL